MKTINTQSFFGATSQEVVGLAALRQLPFHHLVLGSKESQLKLVGDDELVTLSEGGVHFGRGAYHVWWGLLTGQPVAEGEKESQRDSCTWTTWQPFRLPSGCAVVTYHCTNNAEDSPQGLILHDAYRVVVNLTSKEVEEAKASAEALLAYRAAEAAYYAELEADLQREERRAFARAQLDWLVAEGFGQEEARAIMRVAGPGQIREAVRLARDIGPWRIEILDRAIALGCGQHRTSEWLFQQGVDIPPQRTARLFWCYVRGAREVLLHLKKVEAWGSEENLTIPLAFVRAGWKPE